MRNRVSVVLLMCFALALLATGEVVGAKSSKKSIIGRWEVDMLAMMKASLPPEMDPAQMVQGSSMTVTFRKGGTVLFVIKSLMGEQTEEAKWEVVKSEGNALIVKLTDEEGEVKESKFTFKDERHFTATFKDPKENLELTRVKGNVKKSAESKKSEKKTGSRTKRYGVKQACIEYAYSAGGMVGTEILYFDDWGAREAKYERKQEMDRVVYLEGTMQYFYDPKDGTGSKMENPMLQMFAGQDYVETEKK